MKRRAFTLIELLVRWIAIIAILAAILFPVFAKARRRRGSRRARPNMKQLGCRRAYVLGLGRRQPALPAWPVTPFTHPANGATVDVVYALTAFQPYVKSWKMLRLPLDEPRDRAPTPRPAAWRTTA